MYIKFRTRQLEKCYHESAVAARHWGDKVARKYIARVDLLKGIRELNDLRAFVFLRFHSLKGDRKGQYAIDITEFYRLIFSLQGEMMEIIQIEEVSKHYGD